MSFAMAACRMVAGIVVAAAISVVSGCVSLPVGEYRFQTEFERDPMAFRAGTRGEPLVVTVKLQNLSDKAIAIAGKAADDPGLRLSAEIHNASPAVLGQPSVIVGLRGGRTVRSRAEAPSELWLDRHGHAVGELAAIGPDLLGLDPDNVRSSLGLFANEAAFRVVLPVAWDKVPESDLAVPVEFVLSVRISFLGPKGEQLAFPATLQRRVRGYLVNGRRYATGSMPAPNGPVSGEFRQIGP